MMRAGLFGGAWEEYRDALQKAVEEAFWKNLPPPEGGASAEVLLDLMQPKNGTIAPGSTNSSPAIGRRQAMFAQNFPTHQTKTLPVGSSNSTSVPNAGAGAAPSYQQVDRKAAGNPNGVGRYVLPGLGVTYLNPEFAARIGSFISQAGNQGLNLRFTQAYRTRSDQAALQNDAAAITPAKNSLHSAGNAVDISVKDMDQTTLEKLVTLAKSVGLSWGGDFTKSDPVHFFLDTGGDRNDRIDGFSRDIEAYESQIPDR